MKAKFQIQDMLGIGLTMVVLVIAIAYGLQVTGDVKQDMYEDNLGAGCNSTDKYACGAAYNATEDGITGVAKLPEKLPMIATIVVAAIVIGILVNYLWARFR